MPKEGIDEAKMAVLLQRWADGKTTLKEVRGYSDDQLYAFSHTAYLMYCQGRLEEARVMFQGLYAIDPSSAYFARCLAWVEYSSGNNQGALSAFEIAAKLSPDDPLT